LKIREKQIIGNYDALLGKVSNFNWSFSADGSYDIELTIISLGDVIESLKSNLSVDRNTNKFLQNIGAIEKTESTTQTGDLEEEGVVDEENSADIISAMLAVFKFVNNNVIDPGGVQITTAKPTTHNIGARLHPNEGDTTVTVDTVEVEFILNYRTHKEKEASNVGVHVDPSEFAGSGGYTEPEDLKEEIDYLKARGATSVEETAKNSTGRSYGAK
jgi:hypothetical protein